MYFPLFFPLRAETRESFLLPIDRLIQQSGGVAFRFLRRVGVNVHRVKLNQSITQFLKFSTYTDYDDLSGLDIDRTDGEQFFFLMSCGALRTGWRMCRNERPKGAQGHAVRRVRLDAERPLRGLGEPQRAYWKIQFRWLRKVTYSVFVYMSSFLDFRYDKTSETSLEHIWNNANHLITTKYRLSKTEPGNLNFVFADEAILRKFSGYYYVTVPAIMSYAVNLICEMFEEFAPLNKLKCTPCQGQNFT